MIEQRSLTRREAATELGISLSTLKREIRDGRLGYEKRRSRTIIPWCEILNYRARNSVPPSAEEARTSTSAAGGGGRTSAKGSARASARRTRPTRDGSSPNVSRTSAVREALGLGRPTNPR